MAGRQSADNSRQRLNTKRTPRPSSSPGTRAKVAAVTTVPPIPQTWVATSRPWSSVPAPLQALGLRGCSTITHCSPRPNNCSACPSLGEQHPTPRWSALSTCDQARTPPPDSKQSTDVRLAGNQLVQYGDDEHGRLAAASIRRSRPGPLCPPPLDRQSGRNGVTDHKSAKVLNCEINDPLFLIKRAGASQRVMAKIVPLETQSLSKAIPRASLGKLAVRRTFVAVLAATLATTTYALSTITASTSSANPVPISAVGSPLLRAGYLGASSFGETVHPAYPGDLSSSPSSTTPGPTR